MVAARWEMAVVLLAMVTAAAAVKASVGELGWVLRLRAMVYDMGW
jgi:hypothetical protein